MSERLPHLSNICCFYYLYNLYCIFTCFLPLTLSFITLLEAKNMNVEDMPAGWQNQIFTLFHDNLKFDKHSVSHLCNKMCLYICKMKNCKFLAKLTK